MQWENAIEGDSTKCQVIVDAVTAVAAGVVDEGVGVAEVTDMMKIAEALEDVLVTVDGVVEVVL